MPSQTMRVVLDTNVCLDLFVFGDASCEALRAALRDGTVEAVTNDDCRDEWRAVLTYPQLALDDARRVEAIVAYDAQMSKWTVTNLLPPSAPRLPRCADPDDQKFLELAQISGAHWLLSRDNELLKLGRRTQRAGLFGIVTPQAWAEEARGRSE